MDELPKLLLDTNICERLVSAAPGSAGDKIAERMRQDFQVVTSPASLIEMIYGTVNAKNDAHLRRDQKKLRVLIGRGKRSVLPFGGHFALSVTLGISDVMVESLNQTHFSNWIDIVLNAKSLDDLLKARVRLLDRWNDGQGISKELVIERRELNLSNLHNFVINARSGAQFPSPAAWAGLMAEGHHKIVDDCQKQFLATALSAAYEFAKTISDKAVAGAAYNVKKHDGDYIDFQQLWYLCDPSLHLLTADTHIAERCNGSPQLRRIVLLQDFLTYQV